MLITRSLLIHYAENYRGDGMCGPANPGPHGGEGVCLADAPCCNTNGYCGNTEAYCDGINLYRDFSVTGEVSKFEVVKVTVV